MTHDMNAYGSDVVLAVGGFGALRGSSCPGIEAVTLHTAVAGTDSTGSPVSISLHKEGILADVPSPTWIARDGDLLYAVLEDTNEVASFRINRNAAATENAEIGDAETSEVATDNATADNTTIDNTSTEDSKIGDTETSEVATNNTVTGDITISNTATEDSKIGDAETNEVATNNTATDNTAINNTTAGDTAAMPTLTELSRVPASGISPTHAVVATDDIGGKHLIVANYADGHVCVHPIATDGSLLAPTQVLAGEGHGPLPAQEGPHAHWILPLPDGRVLSTDLGADRIYVHHWRSRELARVGVVRHAAGTGSRDLHLLPVADHSHATTFGADWRVAVVGEWADTVTLLGPVPGSSDKADGQNDDPTQATDSDGIRVLQAVSLGGDALDQAASLAFVPWTVLRRGIRQTMDNNGSSAGAAYCNPGSRNNDRTRDADAHGSIEYGITSGSPISESPTTIPIDESSAAGIAYVGLRGSERIVALAWDGEYLSRLAPEHEPGWRGRGIDCGGSRPRHIMRVGNVLLVANEVSNNLTVFRLGLDGEPARAADLPSGSPTVFVRL